MGDLGLIPGLGRSAGEGKGCPLQYSGLENSMDCRVHEVPKSRTQLRNFHFHFRGKLCLFVTCLSIMFLLCFQFSCSCLTLCNTMDRSTPGFPVHHQLLEPTQTHVCRVSDTIQTSHPLSSPSPPAFNLSQNQSLFQ